MKTIITHDLSAYFNAYTKKPLLDAFYNPALHRARAIDGKLGAAMLRYSHHTTKSPPRGKISADAVLLVDFNSTYSVSSKGLSISQLGKYKSFNLKKAGGHRPLCTFPFTLFLVVPSTLSAILLSLICVLTLGHACLRYVRQYRGDIAFLLV